MCDLNNETVKLVFNSVVCFLCKTGSTEFSRIVPPAAQTGDGGEQPTAETHNGASNYAGCAKPLF